MKHFQIQNSQHTHIKLPNAKKKDIRWVLKVSWLITKCKEQPLEMERNPPTKKLNYKKAQHTHIKTAKDKKGHEEGLEGELAHHKGEEQPLEMKINP